MSKTGQTDYSSGKYARCNGLNEKSAPIRAVEMTNKKGEKEFHLVNIETYPEELLPKK